MKKVKSSMSDDANLKPILDFITSTNAKLESAINNGRAESEIEEADINVHNSTRAIFNLVSGYTYHPDIAIQEAANALKSILDRYGLSVIYEGYANQLAFINSLLDDLKETNALNSLEALSGCSVLIDQLKNNQQVFSSKLLQYNEEKAKSKLEVSATELKKELIKTINSKLIPYLKAMLIVNSDNYKPFASNVEQLINDINKS